MLKRVTRLVLAAGLVAFLVWMGVQSTRHTAFVPWFGLACALLPPFALNSVAYAVSPRERELISRLAQVPEIEALANRATDMQEQLRALEEQRRNLDLIIRYEAERRALQARRTLLEADAERILSEINRIDREAQELEIRLDHTPGKEMLRDLQSRLDARQNGDLVIRILGRDISFKREIMDDGLSGLLLWLALRGVARHQRQSASCLVSEADEK